MPMDGPSLRLKALLYCVFDKEEGPIVCCADPPNAVGSHFKPLGRYLLPESFVKGRVVSVVLDENVVLGAPVYIEDTLYDRNCFQFNICAVISSNIDVEPYRDMAQHLASAFHALEVEIKLLSNSANVVQIRGILADLRHQLQLQGQCFVRVDPARCIAFKVWHQSRALPPEPSLYEVPVPLVDLTDILEGGGLDLPFEPDATIAEVARHISGSSTVEEIIMASGLQQAHVMICLRHLLHFDLVAMIDAIAAGSRYWLTPEFHVAFDQPDVVNEVVRYVTVGKDSGDAAKVQIVQGLYAEVDGWKQTLGEFQQAHADQLQQNCISLCHFIAFGLLRGFLERIDSQNQALNDEEASELEFLRSVQIPKKKQELKDDGLSIAEVNRHPDIKRWVARLYELKAKEAPANYATDTFF